MRKPVIVIGLDSAEPSQIEQWMAEGYLKNLRKLRESGAYGRLQNFEYCSAETPWTTFLTGCSPKTVGYWSPIRLKEGTYSPQSIAAYNFSEYSPFYALGNEYKVAVFDMPQARISNDVSGLQMLAWGAHSPQGPSESKPAELFQEIVDRYGNNPGLHNDSAQFLDPKSVERLRGILQTGIARQSQICQDLIQRDRWDLFLTVFGAPHSIGHFMLHLSQKEHPLYEYYGAKLDKDPVLELYEDIDRSIGEILAKAPQDAYIVVFAAHGMGPNTMDLPSIAFLPEFLYRYSFPGQYGIARGEMGKPVPDPILKCNRDYWVWESWSHKYDPNPIRRFIRRRAPHGLFKRIERFLGPKPNPDLVSPMEILDRKLAGDPEAIVPFQPAMWFKPFWPQMKAFALPSFSEGYIRINLKGREPNGIVEPDNYHAVCDEISEKLYALKDARKGIPMVKHILRPRANPIDLNPKLPDADMIIVWQDEYATDTVESPEFGRIGPLPHFRAGSHRTQGFITASGPGIVPNSTLETAHALDLAPTVLDLMDAPIPEHFEGKPIPLRETSVLVS